MEEYPVVTLCASDRVDEDLLEDAEGLLETGYLEYGTEMDEKLARPKLEIDRDHDKEIYVGIDEIKDGLESTDLEDIERRFE